MDVNVLPSINQVSLLYFNVEIDLEEITNRFSRLHPSRLNELANILSD